MKLSKAKLIKKTKDKLNALGYYEVKDTITVANGLYIKLIEKDWFLTLGLTISNYYDSKFTASFYLSKTTIWGAVWGDIPKESYQRVGHFLTKEERYELLSEEYTKDGVTDAWWDGNDEQSIANFINTVEITEKRFLGQPDLLTKIENSLKVQELQMLSKLVMNELKKSNLEEFSYSFIPSKSIDDIPIEWFKASERVLAKNGAILNPNTVKRLAGDAWRMNIVKKYS